MDDETYHLSNRLLYRLFKTVNLMHASGTAWTSDMKITTQQWSVLGALVRPGYSDGVSVNQLADYLMVSRQNVNGVLDRLEQAQLTERVQSTSDRRSRLVRLTPHGWEVWERLQGEIRAFYEQALVGFTDVEVVQFQYLIDRLQKNLKAVRKPANRPATKDKTAS